MQNLQVLYTHVRVKSTVVTIFAFLREAKNLVRKNFSRKIMCEKCENQELREVECIICHFFYNFTIFLSKYSIFIRNPSPRVALFWEWPHMRRFLLHQLFTDTLLRFQNLCETAFRRTVDNLSMWLGAREGSVFRL